MPKIALIGDFRLDVIAHQAIPRSLALAGANLEWRWIATEALGDDPAAILAGFKGLWFVPGSPYRDTGAALRALRVARESKTPTLGTCGGYQHMLMEYAATELGLAASHAEIDPDGANQVIVPLACAMVEIGGEVYFPEGSFFAGQYGARDALETYHCSYGLNPAYEPNLLSGPLQVMARDVAGSVKAIRLEGHPFYVGAGYQPERTGLNSRLHPIVKAFAEAVGES